VFTRGPRPAEPQRDVRFETVLVQADAEQLRALTADLEQADCARASPRSSRSHELNEAGGLRGKVVLTPYVLCSGRS
jgi:hypothetical protein